MISPLRLISKYPKLAWSIPIGLMLFAVLIQYLMPSLIHTPFILLFPALSIGWLFGNRTSNIVATLMGALSSWIMFFPADDLRLQLGLFVFVVTGLTISLVNVSTINGTKAKMRNAKPEVQLVQLQQNWDEFILENMSDAFLALDNEWNVIQLNKQCEQMTGARCHELLSKNLRDIMKKYDLIGTDYWTNFHKVMHDRVSICFEAFYPYTKTWTQCHAYPTQNGGMAALFSDISAQKQTFVRLQTVLDTVPIFAGVLDKTGVVTLVNEQSVKVISCKKEDVVGKVFWDCPWWIDLPQNQQRLKKAHAKAIAGFPQKFDIDYAFFENGELKHGWVDFAMNPVFNSAGSVESVTTTGFDITERTNLRNQAIKSQQTLDQIFSESASSMAFLTLPEFRYERVNKAYLKLIDRHDIIGKRLTDVVPDMGTQRHIESLKKVAACGEPLVINERPIDLTMSDGKKKLVYLDLVYMPLRRADGTIHGIAAQGYDVTEKILSRKAIDLERKNFRELFRQTPEVVCILDGTSHRFEFVNEAHIKILGFDATGKTVREAQPESVEIHGILDKVYQSGELAQLHEIEVTVGDRRRYFNLTYSGRTDESGNIIGVMTLGVEVTEDVLNRQALDEARQRYKALFDHSPIPKLIFDLETLNILDVNETAVRSYGYSRDEFLSLNVLDLRRPEEIPLFKELLAKRNVSSNPTVRHIKKNGQQMSVEISALDISLDCRRARICAMVDVTEKVKAAAEQQRLVETLQQAKAEAERANELKSSFLANMSHEIRTPLGAMIGFTELLRDESLSREEHNNYIDIITRNGEQLSAIINDILDLAKVEAGHLSLDFIGTNPHQIAIDVVSLLRVKADEKNLKLEFTADDSTPSLLITDPLRVRQILLNIIGNAIKFTQTGAIKVRSYGRQENGRTSLYFEVADNGIGIPHSQKERIFDAFVQVDGAITRNFGGTGLGLALSRKLARNLGGDITVVKTIEGKGSTFLVSILDQATHKTAETTSIQPHNSNRTRPPSHVLRGINVLIVDDAQDNRQLISRMLSNYGASVDLAETGLAGYHKAMASKFDLVLMDIQMPEMDGYTATQKLRDAGYDKPIIALTAHAMTEVRKKCLDVGCTDQLTKPIKHIELVNIIAKHTIDTSPQNMKLHQS